MPSSSLRPPLHRASGAGHALLALLGIAGVAVSADTADAERGAGRSTISVNGVGRVPTAPDTATVRAGVVTEATTAGDAVEQNSAAMKRVIAALREAGIAEKDLQTESFQVSPRYRPRRRDQPDSGPRIDGYNVTNRVRALVRDLEKLGTVLDALVREGSNQLDGVQFGVADPEPFHEEARKLAVADARRRAETLAAAGGVGVGPVHRIDELGASRPTPGPMLRQMATAEASVPIAEGEVVFEVNVRVVYDIAR